jgi:large subunit ribosomal protein L9
MKVILLQDVKKIGKKNDVKEVNQGYATNFLLPRGLVKTATDNDVKALEVKLQKDSDSAQVQAELLEETFKKIHESKVTVSGKANEKGHFFSAIRNDEIIKAVENQLNIRIEESWFNLKDQIKEVGERDLEIKHDGNRAVIKLVVEVE